MRNMMNKEQMIAYLLELSKIELEKSKKDTNITCCVLHEAYSSAYELAAKAVERNLKP